MRGNSNGMTGQPPARSEIAWLFERVMWCLRPDVEISRQGYTGEYAGGVFEANGKRWRILIAPEETEINVVHRKRESA